MFKKGSKVFLCLIHKARSKKEWCRNETVSEGFAFRTGADDVPILHSGPQIDAF